MFNNSVFVLDRYFLKWVLVHDLIPIILKTRGLTQNVTVKEIRNGVNKEQSFSLTGQRFISCSGCMRSPGRKCINIYTP
jgi:hypothetical protein